MARITFVEPSGTQKEVEAANGQTVMQVAQSHGIAGIVAECGGCLSCATCHAYIPEDWLPRVPALTPEAAVMVECAADARPISRLTCQIMLTDDLDGLVVQVPSSQY